MRMKKEEGRRRDQGEGTTGKGEETAGEEGGGSGERE